MLFDYLFLPVLFFVALITSYQDLKFGKIKNQWIVLGLIYGLTVVALFFAWDLIAHPLAGFYYSEIKHLPAEAVKPVFTVTFSYLGALLVNFLFAVAVGFLMWKFKAWSAGDAKLFFVFALLLPLKYYSKTYLPFFPSFALLVNIFIPISIFFFFKSLYFFGQVIFKKIKEKKMVLDFWALIKSSAADTGRLLMAFVTLFVLMQVLQRSTRDFLPFSGSWSQVAVLALMYLVGPFLTKIMRQKWILLIFIVLLGVVLAGGFIYFRDSLVSMVWRILFMVVVFLILIGLVRKTLNFYIQERGTREVSVADLTAHSQISQEFLMEIKKESPAVYQSLKKERYWTDENLAAIKDFCSTYGRPAVKVYKSFPFAVWMTIGLTITIILKGSVLSLIFAMLQYKQDLPL